ncbi:hypothetical protein KV205_25190 [Streptomyces sp. SKN60]|uniref:hypothetical protein n=1 Tax=Streptomyces sp. SKN60 TaxID=2855506 RepID=UPI002247CD2D|nr:hypothetical protein [Streptomyces sp. SKN60]MCX2183800.1 hypothetical protein [Streptomyces sp. SKN60]
MPGPADLSLLAAARRGDPAEVRAALDEGARVEARDEELSTPLLRETDIDVDHVNDLGWTALLEAVILGDGGRAHQKVVALLLAAGADRNLADGKGVTPLTHAERRGFAELANPLRG